MDQPQVQVATTNTTMKPFKFHFKKDELGNKRPTVELQLPVLTVQGLADILNTGEEKQTSLVMAALEEIIYTQARQQVNEDADINQERLDVGKLLWDFIANIPPAERRGGGISKEVWDAFAADYISLMPSLTGRSVDKVTNAATILLKKFQPVKTVKPVIKQLKDYLDLWFTNTSNAEEFAECYEFLSKKAETLLAADEAALLANI